MIEEGRKGPKIGKIVDQIGVVETAKKRDMGRRRRGHHHGLLPLFLLSHGYAPPPPPLPLPFVSCDRNISCLALPTQPMSLACIC